MADKNRVIFVYQEKEKELVKYYMKSGDFDVCICAKDELELMSKIMSDEELFEVFDMTVAYVEEAHRRYNSRPKLSEAEIYTLKKKFTEYEKRLINVARMYDEEPNLTQYYMLRDDEGMSMSSSSDFFGREMGVFFDRSFIDDNSEDDYYELHEPQREEDVFDICVMIQNTLREQSKYADEVQYPPQEDFEYEEWADLLAVKSIHPLAKPEEYVYKDDEDQYYMDQEEIENPIQYVEDRVSNYQQKSEFFSDELKLSPGRFLAVYMLYLEKQGVPMSWYQYTVIYDFCRMVSFNSQERQVLVYSDCLRAYSINDVSISQLFQDWIWYYDKIYENNTGQERDRDKILFSNIIRILDNYYVQEYAVSRDTVLSYDPGLQVNWEEAGYKVMWKKELPPDVDKRFKVLYEQGYYYRLDCSSCASYDLLTEYCNNVVVEPGILYAHSFYGRMTEGLEQRFSELEVRQMLFEDTGAATFENRSIYVFDVGKRKCLSFEN
jgi:16S rRNA C967 or C1407 C5-methylase (RsmB/RsmF family)